MSNIIPILSGRPQPVRSALGGPARPHGPVPASALLLLEQADRGLTAAETATEPADRFATSHLAAMRAAAAAVGVLAQPNRRRSRPLTVWALLATLAPNLRQWASFFASHSATRAAVEAGVTRLVSRGDADRHLQSAREFVALVRTEIGASTS